MFINADFSLPATVTADQYQWKASPQKGVERVMLDRVGEEKARATSIVRYATGSRFPRHLHPGGEEILVLSGTFSDEHGDYPSGWYLRNPPGSGHTPFSNKGALIFVKLWQMPADEHHSVRIDTNAAKSWRSESDREICPLFESTYEQVCLQRLAVGACVIPDSVDGAELLVLEGALIAGKLHYGQGSWIRLPCGKHPEFTAGAEGATCFLKTGHLGDALTGMPV